MPEYLDVVNERDDVLGRATREEIYAQKLAHRIVHVLIFNEKGEMALQLRSKQSSFCPLHWGTAAGGHVQAGESYEQAAMREFQEELGTTTDIAPFSKEVYFDPRGITKHITIFRARFNGPFKVNPDEVERAEFFSIEKIKSMMASGEKFHPELLFLLRKYYS